MPASVLEMHFVSIHNWLLPDLLGAKDPIVERDGGLVLTAGKIAWLSAESRNSWSGKVEVDVAVQVVGRPCERPSAISIAVPLPEMHTYQRSLIIHIKSAKVFRTVCVFYHLFTTLPASSLETLAAPLRHAPKKPTISPRLRRLCASHSLDPSSCRILLCMV